MRALYPVTLNKLPPPILIWHPWLCPGRNKYCKWNQQNQCGKRNFGKVIQNYEYIEILYWFLANKFSENSTIRQNVSSTKLSSFTVHLVMSMFKMCCVFFIRVFCMYWHYLKNVLIEYFCLDSFKTLTWFS